METLKDFMIDQLRELYNAEMQLKIIIEKIAYQTSNEELRHLFEIISKRAESQSARLDRIFSLLGESKDTERHSYIMEAIGKEVQSFTEKAGQPEIRDAGFIALAQKAKHYEIALYGTLRDYANELNNREAESMLTDILHEEKESDQDFTERARSGINQRASDKASIPRRFAASGSRVKS
jgi:ferritin-like metal-binding protein YciE